MVQGYLVNSVSEGGSIERLMHLMY